MHDLRLFTYVAIEYMDITLGKKLKIVYSLLKNQNNLMLNSTSETISSCHATTYLTFQRELLLVFCRLLIN